MKKFIALLFVIALLFSLQMFIASADDISLPQYVSIGLLYGENAAHSTNVSAGGFAVTDEYGSPLFSTDGSTDLIVKNEGGAVVIYEESSLLFTYSGTIIIEPIAGDIALNGVAYRGSLKLVPKSEKLTVINIVELENYLYGVLPKEMGGSAPLEALKAQAVTARSYTARFIGRHADDGFDLCTSVHCQVYGGSGCETTLATRAVDGTQGIIAIYDDKIAELYYFASDGGTTESVEHVWGSTLHPYLKAVEDPYETDKATHHTWSVTLTNNEINEIFAGYNLGTITDISVEETSQAGSVIKLKVTGTKGSETFVRDKCRTAFGGKLYSQAYTITKNYDGNTSASVAIDAMGTHILPSVIYVLGSDGKVIEKRIEEVTVISAVGTSQLAPEGSQVTSYTINGRGYGHRIGMSQWGAMAMADQGFTYEDILYHYYTGIQLTVPERN